MAGTSGQSPKEWKCVKIVPIFKKKRKIDPGNYRPVTILSLIYELFEKDVGEQLSKYLECNNLMYYENIFFFHVKLYFYLKQSRQG